MVRLISVMILLGFPAFVSAQAQDNTGQAPEAREQGRSSTTQEPQAQANQTSPSPSRRPAATFTPSEKIRADTSVTFPADI